MTRVVKWTMGLVVMMFGLLAIEEGTARAQCTPAQIQAIANYYWTVKPLCQTQQMVSCEQEWPNDPKSPCRANSSCKKYTLLCRSGSTNQGTFQSVDPTMSDEQPPASFDPRWLAPAGGDSPAVALTARRTEPASE